MSNRAFETLVEVLSYRASYQPDQTGYLFLENREAQEVSLTYQQLDQQARSIAAQLQKLKAVGQRALLLYPSGLDYVAAFFGCLYAGVIAVPAYPPRNHQSISRLQAIIADSEAVIALTTAAVQSSVKQQIIQSPNLQNLTWIATDQIVSDPSLEWQKPEIEQGTLAFLQYTSGSTGLPKGVMVSHGNLLHNLELIHQGFGHCAASKGVIWLPPYHDMGLIGGILQPLYGAFPVVLMSPASFLQKPFFWLQTISQFKATTSGGPNFAYELCVRKVTDEQRATLDLSHWEVAFNGAEPIRSQTLEQFAAVFAACGFRREAFYPCYGMAETTLIVSGGQKQAAPVFESVQASALQQNRVCPAEPAEMNSQFGQRSDSQIFVGCGKPLLNLQVAIAHPEALTRCSPDEIGEIWVAGSSVTQGYWNQPEQTEQSFRAYLKDTGEGPFLRTGDLGFLKDGELFVTGRLKDLMIVRGRNHYPQDIELTVARSHPALRSDAGAAFSVEIEEEECLVVVQEVERTHLRNLDVDAVVKSIRQAVSEQHELQVYAVMLVKTSSIPKTSSGKIQRRACRESFLNNDLSLVGQYYANLKVPSSSLNGSENRSNASKHELEKSRPGHRSRGSEPEGNRSKTVGDRSLRNSQGEILTVQIIEDWLITRLAQNLRVSAAEIDVYQPFSHYGLSSLNALEMIGELEEWLGCYLPPTLVWDYPSIQALARYLARVDEEPVLPCPRANLFNNDPELEQILAELEQLTEEDARVAFGKLNFKG